MALTEYQLAKMDRAVKRGAKFLNRKLPGWFKPNAVKLTKLRLSSCEACVLGQLAKTIGSDLLAGSVLGGFSSGSWLGEKLGINGFDSRYGFSLPYMRLRAVSDRDHQAAWRYLDQRWADEIRSLRQAA